MLLCLLIAIFIIIITLCTTCCSLFISRLRPTWRFTVSNFTFFKNSLNTVLSKGFSLQSIVVCWSGCCSVRCWSSCRLWLIIRWIDIMVNLICSFGSTNEFAMIWWIFLCLWNLCSNNTIASTWSWSWMWIWLWLCHFFWLILLLLQHLLM